MPQKPSMYFWWKALLLALCLTNPAGAFAKSLGSASHLNPSSTRQFEFRGHHIGERIEKTFPNWAADCSNKENGVFEGEDPTVETRVGEYSTQKQVGNVPIILLYYKFLDGNLFAINMAFDIRNHKEIQTMLKGKYGKPDRERIEQVQNQLGTNFDNIVSEWDFKEGTLRLNMRYARMDTSWLTFENPTAEAQIESREERVGVEKGKQAF